MRVWSRNTRVKEVRAKKPRGRGSPGAPRGDDFLPGNGELVWIERAAFGHLPAWEYHFVPGLQRRPPAPPAVQLPRDGLGGPSRRGVTSFARRPSAGEMALVPRVVDAENIAERQLVALEV